MIAAALFAICIPPGPLDWQLEQWSLSTQVQVMFDYRDIRGESPRVCPQRPVSANTALRLLLGDQGAYTYDWVNEETVAVFVVPWCAPELGAEAPTPPCRPVIKL